MLLLRSMFSQLTIDVQVEDVDILKEEILAFDGYVKLTLVPRYISLIPEAEFLVNSQRS
jgi:hypothetical protein